uniref:Mitochondrial nucleoid factor 1 n=1 Tax=Pelusios castaneus TaxID=367368 RepID=A0A8C8RE83_9SAUR
MAAARYRRFLKLCEELPIEETKRGRDLGAFLRQRVGQAFREGERTQIADPANCDQMYESLVRIHTNFYKNKVSVSGDLNQDNLESGGSGWVVVHVSQIVVLGPKKETDASSPQWRSSEGLCFGWLRPWFKSPSGDEVGGQGPTLFLMLGPFN